ncbi:DNA polymerase [Euzebya sp.]|uniref:DNA polymerase n=1 Tax=Euzebya sp. TaxID=1971409 RepID=UPI003514736D
MIVPVEVVLARTVDEVDSWLADAAGSPFLAVDTETTGWDPWTDRIRLVQVAADPSRPVLVLDPTAIDPAALARPLADDGVLKVFHHAAFDLRMLWQAGLEVQRVADTMLAQQLLDCAAPEPVGSSLEAIARHRLDLELDKSVRETFVLGPDQDGPLTDDQITYAATDARATWDCFAQQVGELRETGMVEVARCEFAAIAPLAAMQLRGLGVDPDAWHAVLRRTEDALDDLESAAQAALVTDTSPRTLFGPEPVNLDSPEQVIAALARVGVAVDSTRETVLADHADHPAVAALSAYRQAAKIVHGWGGDWVERARHPRTGRVHASVRQIVGTGRIAHSDPNLTQIPADPAYRRCFTADRGNALVVADYSQQELRVLAAVSGDAALTAVFAEGADLHARTASTVFGVPADAVTPAQRKAAKALNFGLMYGMGAPGFARATGMSLPDARRAMDAYFAGFPQVASWLRRTESQARRTHRVATPLGRVRYLATAGTLARNAPIQGAGADMTKLAVAAVDRAIAGRFGGQRSAPVGLVLTVHDELVIEVPADDADEAADLLRRCMVDAGQRVLGEVPAEVDVRIGRSWAG